MRRRGDEIFETLGIMLTVLVSVVLLFSGIGKIFGARIMRELFLQFGLLNLIQTVGFIEIVLAVLIIVPMTWVLAGFLLSGFFGGAIVLHLSLGMPALALVPLLFLSILLTAMFLRRPDLFSW